MFFIILKLKTKYTSEMEKALQQSHGIGYAEYNRSLKKRLQIENARDKEHQQMKKYISGL